MSLNLDIAMTGEGLEHFAKSIVENIPLTITHFRLATGDTILNIDKNAFFESKKRFNTTNSTYYIDFTSNDFQLFHTNEEIINLDNYGLSSNGYIPINSIELLPPNEYNYSLTIEINCFIPPIKNLEFQINEIMLYTYYNNQYKSLMWGIFPKITKIQEYGLNFKLLIQF